MLTIQEINQLIEKLDQSSIDEFSYEAQGAKIKLKKNTGVVSTTTTVQQPIVQAQETVEQAKVEAPVKTEISTEQAEENEATQQKADYDHEIVSPMVGTFYSSPSPDQPAFVQIGDQVNNDTIVCIVEAMKLFNEIEADVNGTITEILVENGELVEYGQPLFRIKKA